MMPAALATGVGSDVQRGVATVVIGGLIPQAKAAPAELMAQQTMAAVKRAAVAVRCWPRHPRGTFNLNSE
jgi:Cu/Ag efflux pump CusA